MALPHTRSKIIGKSTHTTVGALAYRSGVMLNDEKTGDSYNYRKKSVAHVELILPEGSPQWAQDLREGISQNKEKGVQAFSNIMEGAEKRKDAQLYREFEFAVPREFTDEQNLKLGQEFAKDYIAKRGMAVLINYHIDVDKETGEKKPHIHALISTRPFEKDGLGKKERSWNDRNLGKTLREEVCSLQNFYLKLYGHEARVDHRSYAERGIDLLPQPKMKGGVFELEKRAGFEGDKNSTSAFFHRFVTRVGQDWQEKKTQNMLKVMVRPETIVDVVAAQQSTFVWSDIQEEVSNRVPSQQMAAQVCAQIAESPALVQIGDHRFFEGTSEAKSVPVYTSRKTLEKESDLGGLAQRLAGRERHGVAGSTLKEHSAKEDTVLKAKHGTGLSRDQKEALEHLCSASDLSCMVGYAGSGKSTVLGVATKAWEDSGYKVYGLAPTGRAADNLKDCGLSSSQTLQKFLKGYEHGRTQYNANSILVLDEAGMVPTHLMKEFLGAANHLGVKAVIVGDGNQLQPIEAGAAFRSVLRSTDPVSLETIVRQKQDWQREATKAFGQGKTLEALKAYEERGHIRLRDGLPSLKDLEMGLSPQNIEGHTEAEINLYRLRDTARSLKGVAFGQMLDDVERFTGKRDWRLVFDHKDFETRYGSWKDLEGSCKQVLTRHGFDPGAATREVLKKHGQEDLPRLLDVRSEARASMIQSYQKHYETSSVKEDADVQTLLLAHSRRDVSLLNQEVRAYLQERGVVGKEEFVHGVERPYTDPLKGLCVEQSERSFAKGDVVVFLKNDKGLGVANGNRGRIVDLDKQLLQVELFGDDKKTVSFATNLYGAVDHGWATTIHKSQGSTVEQTLYLAAPSNGPSLAYVAMSRHKQDVQVFGSKEEFGRPDIVVTQLSKSSEKTLVQDYLEGQEGEVSLKAEDSLFKTLSRGFKGLKDFGLETLSEIKEMRDPYSPVSLQDRGPQEVAIDLCSKVLDYWQVRSTDQKETFESDLLGLRDKVEAANPRALQLFKQSYPDQQKTLWRLQARLTPEKVLENAGTQKSSSPVADVLHETRELLRGGDLLGARSRDSKDLSSPFKEKPRDVQEPSVSLDAKISGAQNAYSWSKPLDEGAKGALKSLGITVDPGADARLTQSKVPGTEQLIPAVTYFARNSQGEITGGVKSLIDPKTGEFLKEEGSQRFFGGVKDSFVTLQRDDQETGRTFLTQSPEAGLSLKQAGIEGRIVCTLGEENLKAYGPTASEKTLVVCLDREGRDGASFKTLKEASEIHQEEGRNVVEIVPQQPQVTLNRLLQQEGSKGIVDLLTTSGVACDRQDWSQILTQSIQAREESPEAKEFRTKVLESVGVDTYRSWFKDVEIEKRDSHFVLQGESAFKTETLSAKYGDQIDQVCSELDLTPKFETIGKVEVRPQEKEHSVEKIDDPLEKPVLQEAEKDLSSGDEHVKHPASFEQKEEALLEKAPETVEQKTLDPRDWYAELKGMPRYQYAETLQRLCDKAKDPEFKESATEQIKESLIIAASERGLYNHVLSAQSTRYGDLKNNLEGVGVDFRDLEKLHKATEFTISDRARKDLLAAGETKGETGLYLAIEPQCKKLQESDMSSHSSQIKAAQEIYIVLEGIQSRPDGEKMFEMLEEKYPKSFDRLKDLGQREDILRDSAHKVFGKEDPEQEKAQEQERGQGFERGL